MGYCFEHGIPYSAFMGRVVGESGRAWLEEDVDRVLSYLMYKSEICPNCGTKESDYVDEKGFPLDNPRYQATSRQCFGCKDIRTLEESLPNGTKGVYVTAERIKAGQLPELAKLEMNAVEQRRMSKGLESLPTW